MLHVAKAGEAMFPIINTIDWRLESLDVKPEDRQTRLDSLPGLSDPARVTLKGLDAEKWKVIRAARKAGKSDSAGCVVW